MTHILLILIGLVYFWFTLAGGILLVSLLRQARVDRLERRYIPVYVRPPNGGQSTLKRITSEITQLRAEQSPTGRFRHVDPAEQIVLSIESETEKSGENSYNREVDSVIRRYLSRPPRR